MQLDHFFDSLWQQYVQSTPQAAHIFQHLQQQGEQPQNDHVAFRTFDCSPITLAQLEPHLLALGYRAYESYTFVEKKLNAWGYVHPDESQPKIFLSELRTRELSAAAQSIIQRLIEQIDPQRLSDASVFWQGRLWNMPTWAEYQTLLEQSEYAAWMSVMGLCANHFTIAVHRLQHCTSLPQINAMVASLGYSLNTVGGVIKGSPQQALEQSSTLASTQLMRFAQGDSHNVTTCYYEFAKRYPDAQGQLYQGFVASSADKIFESTHMQSDSPPAK